MISNLWLMRAGLAFVWILTAFTSSLFAPEIGFQILAKAGITGALAKVCVYGGSLLDLTLGIWLLLPYKTLACCITQGLIMLLYTILLSVIDASFWLHPFGPLSKNIPMLILIYILNLSYKKQELERKI